MKYRSSPGPVTGTVRIPGSKSHTVRAVLLASVAVGKSQLYAPLASGDTQSACACATAFGATITRTEKRWTVDGIGGVPVGCGQVVDVANSGTSLYIALAFASLAREGVIHFDGDQQIRRRSAGNLIAALTDLGARIESTDGCCPLSVHGGLVGGSTTIACPTSQYLTALLLSTPLAAGDTEIHVPLLYEQPYVAMTLRWLDVLGIVYEAAADYSCFRIPGRQQYPAFDRMIPADFSTASFFLCAPTITGHSLILEGLDLEDPQGDKAVIAYLQSMGAEISVAGTTVTVHAGTQLRGATLDLNATPDALPIMAVTAAFAKGETRLVNVPQARMKETDRIAVMATELRKLGVTIEELADGLVIQGGGIAGGEVHGHDDHRVVMAFAVAGLAASGPVIVDTAQAAAVTVPNFTALMRSMGAQLEEIA